MNKPRSTKPITVNVEVILNKVLWLLFALLLFFTPLLFTTRTDEAFEFPKMYFVYFVGFTLIFVFSLSRILNSKKQKLKLPNILVLGFIAITVLATVFSSHLYTSIWGYYSRFSDGLVSLLVLTGIYIVGINVFADFGKRGVEKLLLTPVFALIPISVFGIVQHLSMEPGERVSSTFGQPNWLAAYIAMLLPIVFYFALSETYAKYFRWFLVGVFVISYATMWFTYSLSGVLGFIFGMGAVVVLNLEKVRANKFLVGTLVGLCFLVSALNPGVYGARLKDIVIDIGKVNAQTQELQGSGELQEKNTQVQGEVTADATSTTVSPKQVSDAGFIRLGMWRGTLDLALSSPKVFIIGTGPETFPYTFQQFRPADLNYSSEWDYILNKPHNYYLELLAEIGIFGLLVYLTIVVWSLKKRHAYIAPALLAYYVSNFFGFPVVTTGLLFWVLLAILEVEPLRKSLPKADTS